MEPFGRIARKFDRLRVLLCGALLLLMTKTAFAAPPVSTTDPNYFFNTVASRLLNEELGMDLSAIPIYPTNQYTPAVHRLLQVTANILDCTTTNYYPSVFRPIFWKTNELIGGGVYQTNIYITGYQYVQEPLTNGQPIFNTPTDAGDPTIPFGLGGVTNNIYGIPWVIGVKNGLPNFNALEMQTGFFIERKLQFTRDSAAPVPPGSTFPYGRTYATNQMYIMGVSNILGVEFWNSYSNAFTNPVVVVAQDYLSTTLTNDAGMLPIVNYYIISSNVDLATWPGNPSSTAPSPNLFVLPFGTNIFLPAILNTQPGDQSTNNTYVYYYGANPITASGGTFIGPTFIPISINPPNYPDQGTPPLPQFGLQVTNRIQAYILDTNGYILDYVQLGGMNSSLNINQAVADNSYGNDAAHSQGLWSTNYFPGNTPYGVYEQFLVSEGNAFPVAVDSDEGAGSGNPAQGWSQSPVPGAGTDTSPPAQQAFFHAFFTASDVAIYNGMPISNLETSIQAPFTPMRLVLQRSVYQANDPLVHYLTSDLFDLPDSTNSRVSMALPPPGLSPPLGVLNDRYMPWGRQGNLKPFAGFSPDANPYNLSYKDPLVSQSDNWNFPTNETLADTSWLGQVHRGTPWQTIFLKSTNILNLELLIGGGHTYETGLVTWLLWTGDLDAKDASNMAPIQDWHMASYLASLFETNYASLFSVNDANPADWEKLMNGMTVLSNNVSDVVVGSGFFRTPAFATFIVFSNSPQPVVMSTAIESARAAQPLQFFSNVGDIFAVPQLSDASPYLNTDAVQTQKGITDEAYEAIPAQLLPLLRADSTGSIVPASGQRIIQFTGDDNHAYVAQVSCDLTHWTTISTNCPVNGTFTITNTATSSPQFYRTFLVR
jgi:hypothetical protein